MNEPLQLLIDAIRAHRAGEEARRAVMARVDEVFGEFIRQKNWTKKQLSTALHVDPTFVSKLYAGYDGNLPSERILCAMAALWAEELDEVLPPDLQQVEVESAGGE